MLQQFFLGVLVGNGGGSGTLETAETFLGLRAAKREWRNGLYGYKKELCGDCYGDPFQLSASKQGISSALLVQFSRIIDFTQTRGIGSQIMDSCKLC